MCFTDINTTYIVNSTNTQSDEIHPTDAGEQLIANRAIYYMNSGVFLRGVPSSGLTAMRVPFSNTNGSALMDDANMTYDAINHILTLTNHLQG
jgi:hypothetical protein